MIRIFCAAAAGFEFEFELFPDDEAIVFRT